MKDSIKRFLIEEDAQGAVEYILVLVVVVGIALIFRGQIQKFVEDKLGDLGSQINTFDTSE